MLLSVSLSIACSHHFKIDFHDFEKSLYEIDREVGDLTTPVSLFHVKKFMKIHNNADLYYDNAIKILPDKKYTRQQKIITLYMMQSLSKHKYLDYIEENISVYNDGKMEDYLLLLILIPELKQKFSDDKHYKKRVKELVLKINQKSDYFQEVIQDISDR